jgi:hypothetical protein
VLCRLAAAGRSEVHHEDCEVTNRDKDEPLHSYCISISGANRRDERRSATRRRS